jgi:hypothetical protein
VLFYQAHESIRFYFTEALIALQPSRLEPDLCGGFLALNMNMRRFSTVPGIEEESIRSNAQDSWHFN